jgi:hypothetical protein
LGHSGPVGLQILRGRRCHWVLVVLTIRCHRQLHWFQADLLALQALRPPQAQQAPEHR